MDVVASKGLLVDFRGDAAALGVFESGEKGKPPALPAAAQGIDSKVGGLVSASLKACEFTGKLNSASVYHLKGAHSRLAILVGLGKREEFCAEFARQAAARACCAARELGARKVAFCVDSVVENGVDLERAGRVLAEGAILGLYRFDSYKSEKEDGKEISEFHLLTAHDAGIVGRGAKKGEISASSANIARQICNDPGNSATPKKIAALACGLAKKYGFKCRVLGRKEIAREGMNAFLSVSLGSTQEPQFVILEHDGAGKGGKPVVLVGKGITFDSGGISLKPGKDMWTMKFDKSGACAVLGALVAAARMGVKRNVVGLLPLTENMPSGSAAKPGDIVRARSGKTVEIDNTDAEGRLILSDAIDYAKEFKPSAIIDIATLTGACLAALGYEASGLMGNNERLLLSLVKAGEESGERVWILPMWKAYNEYVKSNYADIKNMGTPGAAGTICGAKFLEAFVPDGVPWAHVDIAATAYTEKQKGALAIGATGAGVRLLAALLEELE